MLRAFVCTEHFFFGQMEKEKDINEKFSYIVKRKGYRKNYVVLND